MDVSDSEVDQVRYLLVVVKFEVAPNSNNHISELDISEDYYYTKSPKFS